MATCRTQTVSFRPPCLGVRLSAARLIYGGTLLFDDLAFDLQPGAVTCLLGPSGVGKSSLLRTLAGLPGGTSAAEIACSDGRPLSGRVAWMDQRDLLLPWLTVLDNVTLGSRLRRQRGDRARALDLLQQVGLADRAADRPDRLSGGMRQRVALARTLYEDQPVVLMDEPFSALDTLTRYRLQALAADLLQHRTVLLVTHDPNEALRLAHFVHVMAGRPARLDQALEVPGGTPRDPAAERLQPLFRELMRRLGAADESR